MTTRLNVSKVKKHNHILLLHTGVTAQINPPPPTEIYPGIFWTIPGYNLEYTLGYSMGAPRLYPGAYSRSFQSIPHIPRLYPIRFRVGYSLGDRGIFWEILYMITINYKLTIQKFSRTIIKNAPINYFGWKIICCAPIN